jgi:hypothetical protein
LSTGLEHHMLQRGPRRQQAQGWQIRAVL